MLKKNYHISFRLNVIWKQIYNLSFRNLKIDTELISIVIKDSNSDFSAFDTLHLFERKKNAIFIKHTSEKTKNFA